MGPRSGSANPHGGPSLTSFPRKRESITTRRPVGNGGLRPKPSASGATAEAGEELPPLPRNGRLRAEGDDRGVAGGRLLREGHSGLPGRTSDHRLPSPQQVRGGGHRRSRGETRGRSAG